MQQFLDEIGKIAYGKVHLYREDQDGRLVPLSADPRSGYYDYLKPDSGFVTRPYYYHIMRGPEEITRFLLFQFPNCCAFCVSSGVYVTERYRRRGVNKIANQLRQWVAKEFGYAALVCTDVDTNIGERRTLQAQGFKDLFKIRNGRTGNNVIISVKELV